VRRIPIVVAAVALAAGIPAMAGAAKLPAPGTASQVAHLVSTSHSITSLSTTVAHELTGAASDSPAVLYPKTKSGCTTLTQCVYGTVHATRTVVVMGDSHAQMWLPALNRIGISHHDKVVLLFLPACPAARLDVWLSYTHSIYPQCSASRASWISQIDKLHPYAVVLSDRTYDVYSAASGGTQEFTDGQWQAGMSATLAALASSRAKLAVLGDIVGFSVDPPSCLAANPTSVQRCAASDPNTARPGHAAAERAAAKSAHAVYVDPTRWLCTSTCSSVIGSFIAYYDSDHVSSSYAAFLSTVLGAALKPVL